jgi:glycosyltransferase involved in cell wall biosynthesis
MRKIVQVLPALGWGGAQVFCIQLCNELARTYGYDVTLVSMYHHKPGKHLPLNLLDKKVKFVTLGKRPALDPTMFFKLRKLIEQQQPDVVHTHLHAGYYCFLGYLNNKKGYKKVHTFHNLVKRDSPWLGMQAFKYFFGNKIITPVSISEEVFKGAIEEYGECIKVLIENGSEPVKPTALFGETKDKINKLKKSAATKVLVNIARISVQKKQQLLLESMRRLQNENVICLIIGDYAPDDKKIYDALIANKPDNVFFMGKVNNVSDYLLNADAFVLSSIFEGAPISLLEALSAGVVPVCTPVGGLKNVITKNIGFLSTEVAEDAYTNALKAYLHTPEAEIERLKKNGKALFDDMYSMRHCAAQYKELYLKEA